MHVKRLNLWFFSVLLVLAVSGLVSACGLARTATPVGETPTPSPSPSPSPPAATAAISGRVWHDLCAVTGGEGGTPVALSVGCVQAAGGDYQANGLFEAGEPGIGGVLVELGEGACPSRGVARLATQMNGSYAFAGLRAGTYCVSVGTSFAENADLLPGGWTLPATGDKIASYTVALAAHAAKTDVNFGWDYESRPESGPAPTPSQPTVTPTPAQPTPTSGCYDQAAFVQDVTVPDNTLMSPGQRFEKTWRLRNDGTCTWTEDYALVFVGGSAMGGPASVALPEAVVPGRTLDLSVPLTAPSANGTYESKWLLRNEKGQTFGAGSGTNRTVWVRIVVGPTPTPSPVTAVWRGEYFANRDLSGTPVVVRDEAAINFNWGSAAPAAGLPSDGFSVRWSRTVSLQEGTYRFFASSDDGVRVWLDGEAIIDQWHEGADVLYHVERTLNAGDHTLRIEYYEEKGTAKVLFWWQRQGAFLQWRGAYYPNADLTGAPALVRDDSAISFNWGAGSPFSGIPADGFSARWTRRLTFEQGRYRFRAVVDDGARLWVDDTLVIDTWSDGGRRDTRADYALSAGEHLIRVEYYERAGDALIQVSWERIDAYADWRGEYWSNPSLSGSSVLVRNDPKLDFDWGTGSPAPGVPANSFSARWTRDVQFDAATYRFHVLVDDGARLWVDGTLIIDGWRDGSARELTKDVPMARGMHDTRLEYYEHLDGAQVRLWWEKLATASYPDWRGEYWANRNLRGDPALVRNDSAIDFRWGAGPAAVGLPPDRFSARWSRQVTFEPGTYRFSAESDDGIRFYLDDTLVLDEWHDSSGGVTYRVERPLSGSHRLVVEYYDSGGEALVGFRWKQVSDLPTLTPTPTVTPTVEVTPE